MEKYLAAKSLLFELLPESAVAVVNADDPASVKIVEKCRSKIIRYGFGPTENHAGADHPTANHLAADYQARDVAVTANASNFILHTPDGNTPVRMKLIGRHNVANALTAAALAGEVFGLSVHQIAAALEDVEAAPGRLQWVKTDQPFSVLVDYAHTDDAMENVLNSLRPLTQGKLRVLFGCGGDRDRGKRPRMAGIAAKLADAVYVTSDNPRTENPAAIVEEVVTGIPKNCSKPIYIELDRRTAIQKILSDAHAGDVVLLAGKGHENYQIIGKTKHHFDDVEEAMRVLGTSGVHA
jgi:UDP-N-acetylmuramoyl-L-alanyl-D-glutamate--2,6-diaminopimelate ligase